METGETVQAQDGAALWMQRAGIAVAAVVLTGFVVWGTLAIFELRRLQGRVAGEQGRLAEEIVGLRRTKQSGPVRKPTRAQSDLAQGLSPNRSGADVRRELRELRTRLDTLESKLAARVRVAQSSDAAAAAKGALLRRLEEGKGDERLLALQDVAELARMGDPEAQRAMMHALEDADPAIRREALKGLGAFSDSIAAEELEALLDDPNSGVRRELAKTLGTLPEGEAVPLLMELLNDSSSRTVQEAIKSLVEQDYQAARPELLGFLESEDLGVVSSAGRAMRKFGDPDNARFALERVAQNLHDPDPMVRLKTVKQIRRIKTDGAKAYLQAAAQDEDFQVRQMAEGILEQW